MPMLWRLNCQQSIRGHLHWDESHEVPEGIYSLWMYPTLPYPTLRCRASANGPTCRQHHTEHARVCRPRYDELENKLSGQMYAIIWSEMMT